MKRWKEKKKRGFTVGEEVKKMKKKSHWFDSIAFVLPFLIMVTGVFGLIVKPESIGQFIADFWSAFAVLIAIPVLVVFWWEWDVEVYKISKKRFYFLCGFVVCAAALTVFNLCTLKNESRMIDKAYFLVMSLFLLAEGVILIIKYIKAQRSKQSENND